MLTGSLVAAAVAGTAPTSGVSSATTLNVTADNAAIIKANVLAASFALSIGGTDVFLIGHGYAPRITVRDGNGDVSYTGPVVFLPRHGRGHRLSPAEVNAQANIDALKRAGCTDILSISAVGSPKRMR